MAFSCLFVAGCKKRVTPQHAVPAVQENVYTNRINNAAYIESLKQNRLTQMTNATALRAAVSQRDAYKERVKAALPPGSDEAALEKALAKDDTWLKLKGQSDQAQSNDLKTVAEAREKIRQALMEEARAQKAVAEGKAKAIDQAKTK